MEGNGFHFPLFIDLNGADVAVIGGGAVAARRAAVLLRLGARVRVVSPELCPGFPEGVEHICCRYRQCDLGDAVLAVAATDDREVNRRVGEDARARHIPVSVADCPEECTFYFPAVCEGKNVAAGVVSRGSDHRATARAAEKIRRVLEELE